MHDRAAGQERPLAGPSDENGGTTSRRFGESTLFVLLATVLCLGVASPAIFGAMPDELTGVLVPAAQLTPVIAAITIFAVVRPGRFAVLFALHWGASWRAIGVGIAVLVVIGLAQLGAGLASGFDIAPADAVLSAALAVPLVWVLQCLFAVGEELGWRGWLVSRMRGFGFWTVSAFVAVAWMLWHLPAIPLIVGDAAGGSAEIAIAYLLAIGSWAPFLVALRLWSGSVWPAVIVHGALNSIRVFLTQSIASGSGVNWLVEATGWVLWIAAAALVWRVALVKR